MKSKSNLLNATYKTLLVVLTTIFIFIYFPSCYKLTDSNHCPSCNENITWTSYGDIKFSKTGYDGNAGNGIHLQNTCNWKIFNNNAGGVGHIYQISSCGDGVIFTWAYGILNSVTLSNGWQGSTKEGIRIGDDLDKFLNVYPGFQRDTYNTSTYHSGKVWAYFSSDKKLIRLIVYY